ncbi:hypothetical protein [Sinorhizobium meliloti]|uniref:hypothetical protein n=1 Tax=Rhizobium meliloti TaxID=382 RepID=UPI001F2ABB49|nr:hypothetical protein [Sinorhizobium meliloti]
MALDALRTAIMSQRVSWVLDADLRSFFDSVDDEWLLQMVAHRIADPRILQLIKLWLRAGILESGETYEADKVTPQALASVRSSPTSSCPTSSTCGFINGVDAMHAAEL